MLLIGATVLLIGATALLIGATVLLIGAAACVAAVRAMPSVMPVRCGCAAHHRTTVARVSESRAAQQPRRWPMRRSPRSGARAASACAR